MHAYNYHYLLLYFIYLYYTLDNNTSFIYIHNGAVMFANGLISGSCGPQYDSPRSIIIALSNLPLQSDFTFIFFFAMMHSEKALYLL